MELYSRYGSGFMHMHFAFGMSSLWTNPPVFPAQYGLRGLRSVVIADVSFILVGLFPGSHGLHIQWNQWDGGSLSAHTGIKFFLFTVHSLCPWVPIVRLWSSVWVCCVTLRIYCTHPSVDKYFSTQHRPFSTPARVQRYMDTSMPKSKAGSPGRSFILSCGGRGFISPTRELPRSVKQKDSSAERCMQTCIHYIVHQVFPILELNAQLLVYTVNVQNK